LKKLFSILFLVLSLQSVKAQNFYDNFFNYYYEDDVDGQIEVLNNWQKADPNNPHLAICALYHQLYFDKTDLSVALANEMEEKLYWEILNKSLKPIDSLIELYPHHIDLRIEQLSILENFGTIAIYEKELLNFIETAFEIENKWNFYHQEANVEDLFYGEISYHLQSMAERFEKEYLPVMENISLLGFSKFPEEKIFIEILANVYFLKNQYAESLKFMLLLENQDEDDLIIKSNIALIYFLSDDQENFLKYKDFVIENGSERDLEYLESLGIYTKD
jgi:hypothetical protein